MATVFFAGNWLVAKSMAGDGAATGLVHLLCGWLATVLIFLRLRIFDEIKDWRSDRDLHPERPLPRGLISVREAGRVALLVAVAEGLLTAWRGWPATGAWLVVLIFSLLMFREFFIGNWLRPKMELYAVSHTLVAAWLGLYVATLAVGQPAGELPPIVWGMAVANWAVFNLFEFARKTWGKDEERPGIDSYSRRLGAAGAALLSSSQAGVALAMAGVVLHRRRVPTALAGCIGAALLVGGVCVYYVLQPRRPRARLFRLTMQLFIVAYYLALATAIFLPS